MSPGPLLRVGIDARCLNTPFLRGMGKYVLELITHANLLANVQWHFFSDRPDTVFHRLSGITGRTEIFETKGHRFHAWEQVGLPWRAQRARVQLLHCTGSTLPYWQPIATIVTLHDTLLWQDMESRSYERWYLHRLIPLAVRKCKALITISESSRRDILSLWPWAENKLHVIPHGISDVYLNAQDELQVSHLTEAVRTGPYLLYIGGVLERKRFSWAVSLLARVGSPDLRLLACGFSEGERDKARSLLEPSLRDRVIFLPFVEENDMVRLYQQAVAVLYPTLYEGFGFPALEAQAVGSPVLFSALGSLRELVGPAAEILPVDDLDAWVQTCRRLVLQRGAAGIPNEAARTWARQFSWEVSAARHLEVYAKAAERVSGT